MSRIYPLILSLCFALISQLLPAAVDSQGSGEDVALFLEASTLEEWQLVSGSAEVSDAAAYLEEPSLVLKGGGEGTALKHAFAPEEDSIVRTELRVLPEVDEGGDLSINLNGVSLSFTNEVPGELNIHYYNTTGWIQSGSCESQAWLQLELVQNYSQGHASLKINDALLFEADYFDTRATGDYSLGVKGSGQSKLYVDLLAVSLGSSDQALVDSDEDDLPDSWERQIISFDEHDTLNTIYDVDPDGDADGDGISNADEFAQGTSPTDYYNGQLPVLEKLSGDLQRGAPNGYVVESLVVQVLDISGKPLVNAPVTFEVTEGNAAMSIYKSEQASTHKQITVRTNAEGLAKYGNPLLYDPDSVLFYDDFDGESLDREKWDISTLQVGRTEYGNVPELMVTDGGIDVARLQLDTYNAENPKKLFYGTSIKTYRKFEQKQVVEFEARVRLVDTSEHPVDRGLVGAFSLYNNSTGDEIDWSYLSNQLDESKVLTNIYNNGFPMHIGDVEYTEINGLNTANFNIYTTRWSKDKIDYFVNGQWIRTGPNRGILNDVPEDSLNAYLSFFAPAAGFAEAYDDALQPVENPSLNRSYCFDVDYIQVRTSPLETLRPAGTAPIYLKQGTLGESTVEVRAASGSESVAVRFSALSEYNEQPNITLRNTGDLVYGNQYIVSWDAQDKEGDAKIALYCDTDSSGSDGTLIVENLSASGSVQYIWQTDGVEEGNYYLYAVIDDGVNDPVTAYTEQSIYVPNAAYSDSQLSNGSLETGEGLGRSKIEGWQSSGDAWHYSKQAYQGVFHAKLVEDASYCQDVVTAVGQPWCALVYALNPSEEPFEGAASIRLSFYDKDGNPLAEYQSELFGSETSLDQYIPLKVDAVAPEKSVLARITLSLEGTGSVYFDEASLCKQVELNNSSFELGEAVGTIKMDHWKTFGETYLYEKDPRLGGWHIMAFGTYPKDSRQNYSGCYQEVPAQEGELWHASIYACNPSDNPIQGNSEARLNLVFVDADGNTLPGGENASKSVFSNSLKDKHLLLNISAYAPPGTAYARIVPLFTQRDSAEGCVYFDDARLYKEPGVRNAGFELGDGYGSRLIRGWTPFGEGVYHDHTYPLDGQHHLRLTNEKDVVHTGVYQDFAVIAGEAWRAKLFARILPTDPLQGDIEAYLGFYYLDQEGEVVGGGELNSNKLDSGSPVGHYIPVAVAGIAPEDAVRLRLVPVIRGSGSGTVFMDRVSIEKAYKSHRDRDDDGLPDLWEQAVIDTSERDVLRLRSDIVPKEDLDNDGLDNKGEFVWGTDPLAPDTDGDGMIDGLEIVNYSDPLDSEYILKDLDTDGDGISNYDESVLYGTAPTADTDGDGVSDWVEIFQSFTNPLVDEFGEVSDLLEINGSEYTGSTGSWQNQGASVYARERRGSLNYTLNVDKAGSYRLEIKGRQHNAYSTANYFELFVEVDGIPLGTQTLVATSEQSGTVIFYLPYLNTGEHAVTVQWINGEPETTLEVMALHLQAISGPDLDGNGIADWIDTRLSHMSDLDEGKAFSALSPYTLEGVSYTLKQLKIQSDYAPSTDSVVTINPRQGLIGNYYAHVNLNPEGETAIQVSDQQGAANFAKAVIWTETNIINQEAQMVRKEDSLLLAAFLTDSNQEAAALIEIIAPDGSTETFEITTDTAIAFCFEQVGTYQLKAFVQEAESTLEVEVLNAELGTNPIVYMGAEDRPWSPLVPDQAVLESDPHLYLDELTADNEARNFALAAGSIQAGTIIARLGEDGPIMDSTHVEAIIDYRNSNGSWDVTEVFPDGSRLVEITIQLSDIPEDIRIELTAIKAGVTFDDGLIKRTVTADDFNESGIYQYRMIIAAGVDGSSCHKINFYQGDTWIGGNY